MKTYDLNMILIGLILLVVIISQAANIIITEKRYQQTVTELRADLDEIMQRQEVINENLHSIIERVSHRELVNESGGRE